jgi:prepilin-type N-terminal cleavage/methylation domain-containing protein
MRTAAYSLIEVMIASAIIAVGLAAAAVLVGTLMTQQELNAASLRASNLQEQAVRLYRLDMDPDQIPALLPEVATGGSSPPVGGYAIEFTAPAITNMTVDGTEVSLEISECTLAYSDPSGLGTTIAKTVTLVRPSIRGTAE